MSSPYFIPSYLDEPERFIIFTPDEALAAAVPVGVLGVVVNYPTGLVVAVVAIAVLRKLKQGGSLNRILWAMYWLFPQGILKLDASPPAQIRYFAG